MAKNDDNLGPAMNANRLVNRFRNEVAEAVSRAILAEETAAAERELREALEAQLAELQGDAEETEGGDQKPPQRATRSRE